MEIDRKMAAAGVSAVLTGESADGDGGGIVSSPGGTTTSLSYAIADSPLLG